MKPAVATNLELKCRLTSLEPARKTAERLGASPAGTVRQEDTYFDARMGRLKLRRFENGQAELISYSRPDTDDARWSEYTRVPVRDPEALTEALGAALGVLAVVRKSREVYLIGDTRIHIDNVDGIGLFLELEVVERDPDRAMRSMRRLRDAFGVEQDSIVGASYLDLSHAGREGRSADG